MRLGSSRNNSEMDSGRKLPKGTSCAYVEGKRVLGGNLPLKPLRYNPFDHPRVSTSAAGEKRPANDEVEIPLGKRVKTHQYEDPCRGLNAANPALRIFITYESEDEAKESREHKDASLFYFKDENEKVVFYANFVDIFYMRNGRNVIKKHGGILATSFEDLTEAPCTNGSRLAVVPARLVDVYTLRHVKNFYERYNGPLGPRPFGDLAGSAYDFAMEEFIRAPDEKIFGDFDIALAASDDLMEKRTKIIATLICHTPTPREFLTFSRPQITLA